MELLSLLETLIEKKLIVIIPLNESNPPVIGKRNSEKQTSELISVDNGKEKITLGYKNVNWCDANGRQIYWTIHCAESKIPINKNLTYWFTVSQELKNLEKINLNLKKKYDLENNKYLLGFLLVFRCLSDF